MKFNNIQIKGNVALLTGGAGHVGKFTAFGLAERGVHLVIMDKDEEGAKSLAKELSTEFNIRALVITNDLAKADTFSSAFRIVSQEFDRLDYLVNIAAFYDDMPGWGCSFAEEGYEAWMNVLKVNVMAPFFLAQSLAPLLIKSKNSAIVNVSSIYGIVGPDHRLYEGTDMTNPCSYSVSKAGLNQLTKWLAMVLAPHVRVNTVSPGGIERGQPASFINEYNKRTPLNRMCTNEEVAKAIIYLLSPDASYITAHNLVVDGGWTSW